MDLVADFERIIALCEELEDATPLPTRLKRRIANAYDQATGKAMVLGWYAKEDPSVIVDDGGLRRTLIRHAERGARTAVP
jgi:hypothetical protein